MQWTRRTDLAVEAKEIWSESVQETTALSGVQAEDQTAHGYPVTVVRILDQTGEQALAKPQGTYITVELDSLNRREEDAFRRGVFALRDQLLPLLRLGQEDTVLVVGLGNRAITPDAVGPMTAKHTLATRHLVDKLPEHFGAFRRVAVVQTGVLGTTGMESAEVVRAISQRLRPDRIVAVDALASRKLNRVCRTVQLCDTGIVPGSGIGNNRAALNRQTLGVPVVALGVPTVVDAGTLAADLLEESGRGATPSAAFEGFGGDMIVTPKEIDAQVADVSKLLGYALNCALHEGLSIEDVDMLTS
ncbi:MAG: GPR endopeptidase [Oscillospiraceae bacterium]|nr:GPR endopeptidase [Oscillospiraceae bacterium]